LLAKANCWPKPDLVCTLPPKMHWRFSSFCCFCASLAGTHPAKVLLELNLKTNHQSTGLPLVSSGTGAGSAASAPPDSIANAIANPAARRLAFRKPWTRSISDPH
jgi:hypothetical protein